MDKIPASAVVPTRHRAGALSRTLDSLLAQEILPTELIVVDASEDGETREVVEGFASRAAGACAVRWLRAETAGAAVQRNQGVAVATQPVIWFFDDDIRFEPNCVARLWAALHSAPEIGGANAMITNQRYQTPGTVSRVMFRLMAGENRASYAGGLLGPAVNLLPEDRDDLPEVVPVEWLNTTCTLYRREALPVPPFPSHFTGYSMMEDVTLSAIVGRNWRLVNARTARIFHDSQPGAHKSDAAALAEMELVNRHYVMTCVLGRRRAGDYLRLAVWEMFQWVSGALQPGQMGRVVKICRGKWKAVRRIFARHSTSAIPQSHQEQNLPDQSL